LVGEGNRGGVAEDGAPEFEGTGEVTSAVTGGWAGVGTVREVTEVMGEADAEAGAGAGGWGEAWDWAWGWAPGLRGGGGVWVGGEAGVGIGVGIGSGGETVGAPWGGRVEPVRSRSAVAKPMKTLSG
jgi:hypothetical protein